MGKLKSDAAGKASICFDCRKACGDCSWSGRDPKTMQLMWKPIDGWVAERVMFPPSGKYRKPSWRVIKCPEFEPDIKPKFVVESWINCQLCGKEFMKPNCGRRVYCYDCVPKGFTYNKTKKKVVPMQKKHSAKGKGKAK